MAMMLVGGGTATLGRLKRQQALQQRVLLQQLEQHLVSDLETIRATIHDQPLKSAPATLKQPDSHPVQSSTASASAASTGLVESLSERELEVLRLLAAGMSNQEIAEEFVVTIHTVKWHTKNLYSKLNVRNRAEALARGTELGLI